jgi:hypothetical protein
MKHVAASLLLGLATLGGVNAQPIYRCGNVYSQTPCPQGTIVEATDPRSAAQRAEASRVAADERRLASELRRERLADQAALKPAGASSLSGPPPAKAASAVERGPAKKKKRSAAKPAATTDFIAVDPSSRARRGRK